MGLSVVETTLTLRMLDAGPARTWLGPALRGVIGWQWKSQVCRFTHAQQQAEWRWCGGCPHLADCSFGRNVEPDLPVDETGRSWHNQKRGTPRLVLTPRFPTPEVFQRDDIVTVTVKLIGAHAADDLGDLLDAVRHAGTARGLGNGGTPFALVDRGEIRRTDLDEGDLPRAAAGLDDTRVRVAVRLVTPLVLRDVQVPPLGDLFHASRLAVSQVLALDGARLEVDHMSLRAAADRATLASNDFRLYEWDRKSNRTGNRWHNRGLVGWGVYEQVPLCIVPWLRWGGLIQIGQDRGRGAGAMAVEVG